MTGLPAPFFWPSLPKRELALFAETLSAAWQNNLLALHPGNSQTIQRLYLDYADFPLRWPLFRYLLLHDKKTLLHSLWSRKAFIASICGFVYCSAIVFRNRLFGLFQS